MDELHSNDLLGHPIAAHHPAASFQIDGLHSRVVAIGWDHDAMVGGGREQDGLIKPWLVNQVPLIWLGSSQQRKRIPGEMEGIFATNKQNQYRS